MKTAKFYDVMDRILNFLFYGIVMRAVDVLLHKSNATPYVVVDTNYKPYVILPKNKYDELIRQLETTHGSVSPFTNKNKNSV